MKNTKKEEIRRRMSHGELLRGFNNGNSKGLNNGNSNGSFNGTNNGMNNGSFNGSSNGSFGRFNNGSFNDGSDAQSTNGEETVFFEAQVRRGQKKWLYGILGSSKFQKRFFMKFQIITLSGININIKQI